MALPAAARWGSGGVRLAPRAAHVFDRCNLQWSRAPPGRVFRSDCSLVVHCRHTSAQTSAPRARVSGVRGAGHTRTHTFHISPREAGAALLPLFPSRPGTHSSSPSSHVTHAETSRYLAWVAVRSYSRQDRAAALAAVSGVQVGALKRLGRPPCRRGLHAICTPPHMLPAAS